MPDFIVYLPTILLVLVTLAVLITPTLKNTLLTILCTAAILGTFIYYFGIQAKTNAVKYISDQKSENIKLALNNFSKIKNIKNQNTLFCNAMLYAFSAQKKPQEALLNTAECYDKKGFPSIGRDINQHVLKHSPDYPPALYLKTKAELKTHGIDSIEFTNSLNKLLTKAPDHPDGLWLFSAHQYYKGHYKHSLITLDKIETLIKNNNTIEDAQKKLNKLKKFRKTVEQALADRNN